MSIEKIEMDTELDPTIMVDEDDARTFVDSVVENWLDEETQDGKTITDVRMFLSNNVLGGARLHVEAKRVDNE